MKKTEKGTPMRPWETKRLQICEEGENANGRGQIEDFKVLRFYEFVLGHSTKLQKCH